MKDFWKDYSKLCKDSGAFYKKHWKGVLVLNAAIIGVEYAVYFIQKKKSEKELAEFYKKQKKRLSNELLFYFQILVREINRYYYERDDRSGETGRKLELL